MRCRLCNSPIERVVVDLGHQPPSNAYLTSAQLLEPEISYPLQVRVCEECWLVQLPEHASASELFTNDYAYFSSVSSSWVEHARQYVEMISSRLSLDQNGFVVEIASNDGYLLQFFKRLRIPCLGVEPTESTAAAAKEKSIETIQKFFSEDLAHTLANDYGKADLIIANNVLAHVPNLNDFVAGTKHLLAKDGVITVEFPHLRRLVEGLQFDTIYHEHYSYFSFTTACTLFKNHSLRVFDVEELQTHGGSLRVFVTHADSETHKTSSNVMQLLDAEKDLGVLQINWYDGFSKRLELLKRDSLSFLIKQKSEGKVVAAYGAAAKGSTFLNYMGIRQDFIEFVCDAAKSKQNKFLPGSHIPIKQPDFLKSKSLGVLIILPWNISDELTKYVEPLVNPSCQVVTLLPCLRVLR